MRRAIMLVAVLATFAGTARAQLAAAAGGTTNIVIVSESIEEPAWRRQVVMQSADGGILNDSGQVGSAAEAAAAGEAAEHAGEISDAANVAMTNALQVLDEASEHAATNAIALALVVAPETIRSNLTAYVVKTESDSTNDTQWVWFNRQLALAPSRYVVYETYGRAATNRAEWVEWTNTVTVVKNGRTWEGCHVCTVARPAWARGVACLDLPNEKFGGPFGFDFGDMLLTTGGQPLYTGLVTNGVTGEVLYFDNGFCKGSITGD